MSRNGGFKKWFWNVIIFLVILFAVWVFALHYKNWTKIEEGKLRILSGIYLTELQLDSIQEIIWVPKIPKMERKSGFSWRSHEKGIFKDSVTGHKVAVFVDDLYQHKVYLRYNDSLQLYFNTADSLKTQKWLNQIKSHLHAE